MRAERVGCAGAGLRPERRGYTPLPMHARHCASLLLAALAVATTATAADIDVKVLHFGAGGIARAGGTLAVQAEFRSALDRPVEVEAVWEVPNADLDLTEFSRGFVLNPGQAQRRWLYATLPPLGEGTLRGEIWNLRLYEVEDGRRARDLGTAKIAADAAEDESQVLGLEQDAILVVGPRSYGLDVFAQATASGTIPSMNVVTFVGNLRDADAFPDRWEGYAPFDALVWGGASVPPGRVSEDAVEAILEWTARGGNLVIAPPAAGDPWSIGVEGRHGLSGVLPRVAPERIDDVRIADLLPMLSTSAGLRAADARTRLAVFDPATLVDGWRPFLAVPARFTSGAPVLREGSIDGRVVGIRRAYGFGQITLLGIDVEEIAARGLQTPTIPQGDVFWNRILGRRADTPSGAEYTALAEAGRLAGGGYGYEIRDGELIGAEIGLVGQAAVGILAATAVFGLYWLVAGPLGFAVLKMLRRERWAWVSYVGVAAVFTAVIWAAGASLGTNGARIRHFTVLDAIAPAQGEEDPTAPEPKRATGWFSLFTPGYGTTEVALDPDGAKERRNLLASWRGARSDPQGFPSRERYRVAVDAVHEADVPSRATAVDFKANWVGAVDTAWGRMPTVASPVAVRIDRSSGAPVISISGSLTHALPGALTDVTLVHVWPVRNPLQALRPAERNRPAVRRHPDQLPNRGEMVAVAAWAPGEELDLAKAFGAPVPTSDRNWLDQPLFARYYEAVHRSMTVSGGLGLGGYALGITGTIEMLSFYGMLEPPAYLQNPPSNPPVLRVTRVDSRELDLSERFTEPCLIVIGTLSAAALPYPVLVDGERVPSEGRVVVRWVLPLPAPVEFVIPERFPVASAAPSVREEPEGAGDPTGGAASQDEPPADGGE